MLGLFWSLSDEVLMSDLPPPYTIGEANVSGTNVSSVLRYVGFTSPHMSAEADRLEKVARALEFDRRPVVFIQISGPNATKKIFQNVAIAAIRPLSQRFNVVLSLGYPKGSVTPQKVANGAWLYEWCPVKDELFQLSSVVVARAGHGTIGQCINQGTPAVLVPIFNHSEQLANAEKYERLGLGIALRPENLSSQTLAVSVTECHDNPTYKRSSELLMHISRKLQGVEEVVRVVRGYL